MYDATTIRLDKWSIILESRGQRRGETGRVRGTNVRYELIVLAYRC
jgi:hypothetical protein